MVLIISEGYGLSDFFLRIIRCPQIGLSDKISLLCHAIVYIAHFTLLLVLTINLLGCLWIIVMLYYHTS